MALANSKNLFTLDGLETYVNALYEAAFERDVASNSDLSDEERTRKKIFRNTMRSFPQKAKDGDRAARNALKNEVRTYLTSITKMNRPVNVSEYPKDYHVTKENIDMFLPYDSSSKNKELRWRYVHQYYLSQYGDDWLENLIHDNNLSHYREDRYGTYRHFIDDDDIERIYKDINYLFTYEDRIEILVQIIYERLFGLSILDSLYFSNIDELSVGESGLASDDVPNYPQYRDIYVQRAYDSIHVILKSVQYRLDFLSLGSFKELERVWKLCLTGSPSNSSSKADGFTTAISEDGARRTFFRPPFGEVFLILIRHFSSSNKTFKELVDGDGSIENTDYVVDLMKFLHRGQITHCINGPQMIGKTTALKAAFRLGYHDKRLRMTETDPEAKFRRDFPGQSIFTIIAQTESSMNTGGRQQLDEIFAFETSLRSSGQVTIISEARGHKIVTRVPETSERGSDYTTLSYHVNDPRQVLPQMAYSFLHEKLFTNYEHALRFVQSFMPVSVTMTQDPETKNRYYSFYEFRRVEPKLTKAYKKQKKWYERISHFIDTLTDYMEWKMNPVLFETVPILEIDIDSGKYVKKNPFSQNIARRITRNLRTEEERIEFNRYFQEFNEEKK